MEPTLTSALSAYLFSVMTAWYPVKSHNFTKVPQAKTEARYHDIADDLATAVLEEGVPVFFESTEAEPHKGVAQTALLALSIAGYESGGFRADVDNLSLKGDGGSAVCLMQVHGKYAESVANRLTCFRAGLRAMKDSKEWCGGKASDWLTGYTVGRCLHDESEALRRWNRAVNEWTKHRFVFVAPTPS